MKTKHAPDDTLVKSSPVHEPTRTGLSAATIKQAFLDNLFYVQGRFLEVATPNDHYQALAYTLRDRLLLRWVNTVQTYKINKIKGARLN